MSAFPKIEPMTTRGACATETGPVREVNEDACGYFNDTMASLAVAADGCGGGSTGRPAADLCVETSRVMFEARRATIVDDLAEAWWRAEHADGSSKDVSRRARPYEALPIADRAELRDRVARLLETRIPEAIGDVAALEAERRLMLDIPRRAITRSHEAITRAVEADRRLRGMGAAVVIAIFSGGQVAISHVGDCRAYRLRGGVLETLTEEHSLANEYKRSPDMNPAELAQIMATHANVITRALGVGTEPMSDGLIEPVLTGDSYVLMTDGAWKLFPETQIKEAVTRFGIGAAAYLCRLGSRQMPNHPGDNLSVAVVQIL